MFIKKSPLIIKSIISVFLTGSLVFTPISGVFASISYDQEITETAKVYIGVPFKKEGATPEGFDASGFVQYVFKDSAPNIMLPRTTKEQYKKGRSINKNELQAGDLLFFDIHKNGVSFVGIYLDKNTFIGATKKGVCIQSLNEKYWSTRYIGAKRIIDTFDQ